mmetsp:Transcript_9999/g.15049  ORF Transcript_9999/g.15049 Transcript_9999/m.15049 type:complete len:196 (+) Transcript_9999:231-818(+)|eukprot:CAMPEP_0171452878 /NCGR_PEP_ID=MMETSP0945-20130129/810_1 /TAXON_ID=109269 /ORGANISM="Vaucheria litorea, Strain CCMP2940" /LENGTH=195 /DNA_ID=CAMNT_0011977633 /DNA_START=164 /DNA_END=751 /DNA_ORIENTATION=+
MKNLSLIVWYVFGSLFTQAFGSQPSYPIWPDSFHGTLKEKQGDLLSDVDLYYNYPKGVNVNIIRKKTDLNGTLWDIEWNNGTSYFFHPLTKDCQIIKFGVGILPPNWLEGATYLGIEEVDSFQCNKWQKGDSDVPGMPFITYWDDVETRKPFQYQFFSGSLLKFVDFEPISEEEEKMVFQVPDYCFSGSEIEAVE